MNKIDRQFALRLLSILVIVVPFLVLSLASPSAASFSSDETSPAEQPAKITHSGSTTSQPTTAGSLASSSIDNKNTGFNQEIPGVGAFFSDMLDSLIGLTTSSEKRFQVLAEHFPLIFADLYKVFITL